MTINLLLVTALGILTVNGNFLGGQREKNRQKEGHSGGTYVYEKYREYPPPPPPRATGNLKISLSKA